MFKRARLSLIAALGSLLSASAFSQPFWPQYAGNPQHTAQVATGVQAMKSILWQTPVDLFPPYSGSDLLIHYGSTLIASGGTAIVTVRTGPNNSFPSSNDTFRVEGHDPGTGATLWTESTDYTTPPHDWIPSCGSCIAPGNQLYTPGAGGTIWVRSNADSASATVNQLCFYGLSNYQANQSGFNGNVWVCTPLTVDSSGDIFFGFLVSSGFSNGPGLTSGIARISSAGVGTWVSATVASGVSGENIPLNCAPALSNDGKTLYVAAEGGANMLLRLDSTTLATVGSVNLVGPNNTPAYVLDDGTPTPLVGPDGDVYYGTWYTNDYRGFMLHYSGDLTQTKTPGAFGWDDTASVVPASCVPSYSGSSSYLILTKYNNYINAGDGMNHIAVLDPNDTETYTDASSGQSYTTMKEVITLLGPTPNPSGGVDEWCINTAAIDVLGKAAIVNSEDGHSYRWDFTTNSITDALNLAPPTGEAYTPTMVSADGIAFAVNNAQLCAMWDGARPTQVSLAKTTLTGGSSTTCTVTLSDFATGPGANLQLSSDNACLQVPSSVHVPAGQNSVTFNVTTTAVNAVQTVTISAGRYGFTAGSGVITVNPPAISGFTISPSSTYGNHHVGGTITLAANAVGSGDVVTLSGGDSSISYPSTVTVPAGSNKVSFTIFCAYVSANDTETLTATLGPSSKAGIVTILPYPLKGLTFTPTPVVGGQSSLGTLTMNGHAGSSPAVVTLSGGDSSVSYPSSVSIPAGGTSVRFKILTSPVSSSDNETITATLGASHIAGTITVATPNIVGFTFSPSSQTGGYSSAAAVTLSGHAGPSGDVIAISGGDANVSYPSTVTVSAGQTQGKFKVLTSPVASSDTETLLVSLGSSSLTGTLTVTPPTVSTLAFNPATVTGGSPSSATVTLHGKAGPGGVVVSISGGDSSVSYPATVTIPAGQTSKSFTVNTSAVSSVTTETLKATFGGSNAQATLTLNPPGG